ALNDATAKRIISEIIVPDFKRSEYYAGIAAGLDRMIGVIEGEPLPAPQSPSTTSGNSDNSGALLFFAFVLVTVVGGMLRTLFGRLAAAAITGLIIGFLAWFLVASLLMTLVGGVIAFFLTLVGGGRGYWGGFGGPGGGLAGGGGFGGGGFGGGGGGFGGGGASGSW
ncbi:MAG: TPM domain-containing protein, partial [Betaproteobacteria bacterium]|nr:TPM domain-containing protein [Betaproteobacteria bacterium]